MGEGIHLDVQMLVGLYLPLDLLRGHFAGYQVVQIEFVGLVPGKGQVVQRGEGELGQCPGVRWPGIGSGDVEAQRSDGLVAVRVGGAEFQIHGAERGRGGRRDGEHVGVRIHPQGQVVQRGQEPLQLLGTVVQVEGVVVQVQGGVHVAARHRDFGQGGDHRHAAEWGREHQQIESGGRPARIGDCEGEGFGAGKAGRGLDAGGARGAELHQEFLLAVHLPAQVCALIVGIDDQVIEFDHEMIAGGQAVALGRADQGGGQ